MKLKPYQFHHVFHGDRSLPVILWLHGFMGSGADFAEVISLLTPHFCCLTVDLPGHGLTQVSAADTHYQMSATAKALIELLQQLKIKTCSLVGYSLGGRLALYLAVYFPGYFKQVILESASPGLKTASARKARIKQDVRLAQALESLDFPTFLARWYANPLFASIKNHPQYETMIARRLNNNPLLLAKSLRHMGTGKQPSLWKQLNNLSTSLLLIVGELDYKFVAINREMARLNHQIKLKIIPQCGHNIHLENPQQLSDVLISEMGFPSFSVTNIK